MTKPLFSEEEASQILKSMLTGLHQVHQQNLLHRDIKPENVVLGGNLKPDPNAESLAHTTVFTDLRVIDFGFSAATKLSKWDDLDSNVGTTLFMAPEQISTRTYGKKIDVYACGITLYYLLAGHHPLFRLTDTTKQFQNKVANIGPEYWNYPPFISDLAKDFIQRLCSISQSTRYEAKLALEHPWITRNLNSSIPRTFETDVYHLKHEQKLLKGVRLLTFLAIVNGKRSVDCQTQ